MEGANCDEDFITLKPFMMIAICYCDWASLESILYI